MGIEHVTTLYQTQINLQSLFDLDSEIVEMMSQIKNSRRQIKQDKKRMIESIHEVFDNLQQYIEARRN